MSKFLAPLKCPLCDQLQENPGPVHDDFWHWLTQHLRTAHHRPDEGILAPWRCWCEFSSHHYPDLIDHYRKIGLKRLKQHVLMGRIANL